MKRFRSWRSFVLIILLIAVVFGGWYYATQMIRATYPQAWSDWRDKIQDAVTEYGNTNNGSLPIVGGGAVIVDGEEQYIIDICALVEMKFMPSTPASCISLPGTGDDNCDGGNCSCSEAHHYIWTVDAEGSVDSACIGQQCDQADAGGYQGIWP
jgi:hypothetical protein